MVILSALLASMVSKGILTEEESLEVADLYSLEKILEGAASRLLSPEERIYVGAVNDLLRAREFDRIEELKAPKTLLTFKTNLDKLLDSLRELFPAT